MADKQMCVYKITNTENGKFYIGSTVDFTTRKCDHLRKLKVGKHTNKHLQNSYNKYGLQSFSFEVIFKLHNYLKPCLRTIEERLIKTLKPDYNILLVTRECREKFECKPETRALISASLKITFQDPEIKAKMRERRLGKPLPEKTKGKISLALRGNTNNLDGAAKHWIVTRPDGVKEEVYNLAKYCTDNGMKSRALRDAARGWTKQHNGYKVEAVVNI